MNFEPYESVQIDNNWYISVITYNQNVWYPWQKRYVGKVGQYYPTKDLYYARQFSSKEEADKFIKEIY